MQHRGENVDRHLELTKQNKKRFYRFYKQLCCPKKTSGGFSGSAQRADTEADLRPTGSGRGGARSRGAGAGRRTDQPADRRADVRHNDRRQTGSEADTQS